MNAGVCHKALGVSLVEVLVALLVIMIGLLGMAGLQGRALTTQLEAYQRTQALVIARDMAARINNDRDNAASYIAELGTDSEPDYCDDPDEEEVHLCAWHDLLLGAAETTSEGDTNLGGLIGARGCIEEILGSNPPVYRVTVAWQGLVPTSAPDVECGEGAYGDDDTLRRVITLPVTIGNLN